MEKEKILEVTGLVRDYKKAASKGVRETRVLKGVGFSVEKGGFVGIMGKSGCGKTTLLRVLGLIDKQTKGTLLFKGKDTKDMSSDEQADLRRTGIGFVFQDSYLLDGLSVRENIMLPMIVGGEDTKRMLERSSSLAGQFEMDHLLSKDPHQISGGEKQRAAVCRALINDPELILADEPTGNLDSKSGELVIEALCKMNRELGKTIVMVTHDPGMASYCEKVILLKDGTLLETLYALQDKSAFYEHILKKMEVL